MIEEIQEQIAKSKHQVNSIRISPKNKDYKTIRNHFKEYKFETIDHKEAIIITFKHGKA
jgi:hypothetical protein